jgi:hypothetical protein
MRVNPELLDAMACASETQPMVDRDKTETIAERFEKLRAGMSYQALSDAIFRKTGVRISPQAMHKWSKGGNIDPDNVKPVCEFFGVTEAWLVYGAGRESTLTIDGLVSSLPDEPYQRTLDFIRYQLTTSGSNLFAGEPEKLGDYLKFIDRLINGRKDKK